MNNTLIRAIRGPIVLITIGTLFAIDHAGGVTFRQSWPVVLVVLGLFKLLEHLSAPPAPPPPSGMGPGMGPGYPPGAPPPPYGGAPMGTGQPGGGF